MTIREVLFGRKKRNGADTASGASANGTAPDRTGTIGKYEIVEKIGHGGFGTVYRAWDPLIKRNVAIKTCEVGNKDIRNRFFREGQVAGGLQHPNITMVYEFGFAGDVPFMVQEFLNGEDLDRMIKRGAPLSLQQKLKILIGITFGLEYAHKAGVMHRDIKPGNIRILENQAVKIMDFGIAKLVGSSGDITQTGITLGSSSYMSPEQIGGDAIDCRTDIFSFGVLAYELLAYRKPFRNENLFLLLEQIVNEDPVSLAETVPDLPPALVAVVERAMQKKPEDRFASARALRSELVAVEPEVAPAGVAVPVGADEAVPDYESARLHALDRLEILDTAPEREFDDLAVLASRVCDTPFASISFLDRDREWIKSAAGFPPPHAIPRAIAFAPHVIRRRDALVVPDASADGRFAENPLVTGEPGLRFFAGVPLVTSEEFAVGTLAVLDRAPRELTAAQLDSLKALARQVAAQLDLRWLRRAEREQSGEKLILEVAGLSDNRPGANAEKRQ